MQLNFVDALAVVVVASVAATCAAYILHTMLLVLVSFFVVAIVALWPVISIDFVAAVPVAVAAVFVAFICGNSSVSFT